MDASNFTLYSISFILEIIAVISKTFFIPKPFQIEQGTVFNLFIFVWFVIVWR